MAVTPEIPSDRFAVFAGGLDHPEGLAFARDGTLWAGGEAGQIYRIDSDGRAVVHANLGNFCAGLAFSPADELFVCVANVGVVRVERDGTSSVFASASPTGDRIAFHRRVGLPLTRGHLEVYTMNADGTDVRQITFTPPPGFSGFPSWGKWSERQR